MAAGTHLNQCLNASLAGTFVFQMKNLSLINILDCVPLIIWYFEPTLLSSSAGTYNSWYSQKNVYNFYVITITSNLLLALSKAMLCKSLILQDPYSVTNLHWLCPGQCRSWIFCGGWMVADPYRPRQGPDLKKDNIWWAMSQVQNLNAKFTWKRSREREKRFWWYFSLPYMYINLTPQNLNS